MEMEIVQIKDMDIKNNSYQKYEVILIGNKCYGHTQYDSNIMDNSRILAISSWEENNTDSNLIHEAIISKISEDELIKLMTLVLTIKETEKKL